jgi:hypothetical protein
MPVLFAAPLVQAIEPIFYPLHDRVRTGSIARVSRQRFGMQQILLQTQFEPCNQRVNITSPATVLVHRCNPVHPSTCPLALTLNATA